MKQDAVDPGTPVAITFPRNVLFRIIQVGCGGTGAYVVPDIARLLYALKLSIPYTLIEGDAVEEKNIVRQNFVLDDIGRNKAEVVASRYGTAYGIDISFLPQYAESEEIFDRAGIRGNGIPILIGAVDNTRTRQLLHQIFHETRNVIYIDAGNGETDGQVVLGLKLNNSVVLAPAGDLFPDLILGEGALFPSQVSCADVSLALLQTLCANRTAATVILWFLHGILVGRRISFRSVVFDFARPYFRAVPITWGMVKGYQSVYGMEISLPAAS